MDIHKSQLSYLKARAPFEVFCRRAGLKCPAWNGGRMSDGFWGFHIINGGFVMHFADKTTLINSWCPAKRKSNSESIKQNPVWVSDAMCQDDWPRSSDLTHHRTTSAVLDGYPMVIKHGLGKSRIVCHIFSGGFSPPLWKIWVRQLGWWHSQY